MSSSDETDRREPGIEVQEADWEALRFHLERGGLVTVSQDLDLESVGVHVAEDDKPQVEAWVEKGLLGRPNDDQVRLWDETPKRVFRFVIVQPFVLIQHKAH